MYPGANYVILDMLGAEQGLAPSTASILALHCTDVQRVIILTWMGTPPGKNL